MEIGGGIFLFLVGTSFYSIHVKDIENRRKTFRHFLLRSGKVKDKSMKRRRQCASILDLPNDMLLCIGEFLSPNHFEFQRDPEGDKSWRNFLNSSRGARLLGDRSIHYTLNTPTSLRFIYDPFFSSRVCQRVCKPVHQISLQIDAKKFRQIAAWHASRKKLRRLMRNGSSAIKSFYMSGDMGRASLKLLLILGSGSLLNNIDLIGILSSLFSFRLQYSFSVNVTMTSRPTIPTPAPWPSNTSPSQPSLMASVVDLSWKLLMGMLEAVGDTPLV